MIEAVQLSKSYPIFDNKKKSNLFQRFFLNRTGEKKALSEVSFHVSAGEFIGLLGPNGAGKSTLIKLISGVLAPTSGTIRISGLDPVKQRKEHTQNIGVLFGQKTQLWWDLPLIYSLRLMGEIYNLQRKKLETKIDELVSLIGLQEFIDRPVRQLSLGERMRGEIAAVLIHEPSLLLLDEPTIGLDVLSKFNLQNVLRDINNKSQTTVILTTHNVDDIEKLCKRVIFINYGSLIFDDSIHELKQASTQKKYIVIETEGDIPRGFFGWEKREHNKYWFPLFDENDIYVIFEILKRYEVRFQSFTVSEPQLDEVIRELYQKNQLIS